jgi:hypothetical protein
MNSYQLPSDTMSLTSAMSEFNLFNQPPAIHSRENNSESQEDLEQNEKVFSEQCALVYRLLKSGMRLTVADALNEYKIGHLPRRICE